MQTATCRQQGPLGRPRMAGRAAALRDLAASPGSDSAPLVRGRWRIGQRRSANVAEAAAQLAELRRARPDLYPPTAHAWAAMPPREELAPPLLCAVCFQRTRPGTADLKVGKGFGLAPVTCASKAANLKAGALWVLSTKTPPLKILTPEPRSLDAAGL